MRCVASSVCWILLLTYDSAVLYMLVQWGVQAPETSASMA